MSPTLFYVFVDFGKNLEAQPVCHVVPSVIVADVVYASHQFWLSAPGKKGQQRKDNDLRRFLPDYDKMGVAIGRGKGWLDPYREGWTALEASV